MNILSIIASAVSIIASVVAIAAAVKARKAQKAVVQIQGQIVAGSIDNRGSINLSGNVASDNKGDGFHIEGV